MKVTSTGNSAFKILRTPLGGPGGTFPLNPGSSLAWLAVGRWLPRASSELAKPNTDLDRKSSQEHRERLHLLCPWRSLTA